MMTALPQMTLPTHVFFIALYVHCICIIFMLYKWNGMEWHGMEWNGMKWNEMKWNEMKWNEMKWNEMKWNEMKWNEMKWNEMKWNEMKWNEMKWNEMKWNEMKWNEMKWNEMKWLLTYQDGWKVNLEGWASDEGQRLDRGESCDLIPESVQEDGQAGAQLRLEVVAKVTDELTPGKMKDTKECQISYMLVTYQLQIPHQRREKVT